MHERHQPASSSSQSTGAPASATHPGDIRIRRCWTSGCVHSSIGPVIRRIPFATEVTRRGKGCAFVSAAPVRRLAATLARSQARPCANDNHAASPANVATRRGKGRPGRSNAKRHSGRGCHHRGVSIACAAGMQAGTGRRVMDSWRFLSSRAAHEVGRIRIADPSTRPRAGEHGALPRSWSNSGFTPPRAADRRSTTGSRPSNRRGLSAFQPMRALRRICPFGGWPRTP
jgi:hypothetical protein